MNQETHAWSLKKKKKKKILISVHPCFGLLQIPSDKLSPLKEVLLERNALWGQVIRLIPPTWDKWQIPPPQKKTVRRSKPMVDKAFEIQQ